MEGQRVVRVTIVTDGENFPSLAAMEREVGHRLNGHGGGSPCLRAFVRPLQVTRTFLVPGHLHDVEVAQLVQEWLDSARKPECIERL